MRRRPCPSSWARADRQPGRTSNSPQRPPALGVAKSFGAAMGTTGSNTLTATLSSGSTGAGDLLVVVVRSRTATAFTPVSSITDSSGTNVWTAPPAALKSQKVQADEEIWYLPNAASVTSVTVTMAATTSVAMTVLDVTGTSATPLDKTSSTFNTSTAAYNREHPGSPRRPTRSSSEPSGGTARKAAASPTRSPPDSRRRAPVSRRHPRLGLYRW